MGKYRATIVVQTSAYAAYMREELYSLDSRPTAIERLQEVFSELSKLQAELIESDIEPDTLTVVRDAVYRMRMIALSLHQALKRFQPSQDKQDLLTLLVDERMRQASQLNTEINKDFETGRIRTDYAALSAYVLVLNQVMEQVDLMFESCKVGG